MTRTRLNLADTVEDLAPPPPPCFLNRASWREYLKSAAAVQNHKGEPKVILLVSGSPAFNHALDFCSDCSTGQRSAMVKQGRCQPDHLKKLTTTTA